MARYGPPGDDDFHNQPTEHANWGPGGPPQGDFPPAPAPDAPAPGVQDQAEQPQAGDPFDQPEQPTPWYRRPVMLVGWALLVLILIGLIVFGIVELIHGDQGTGNAPSTSTTSTTSTTTTTTTTTPATTTTTPPTTSASSPPPPQPTYRRTQQPAQPPPHHHLPHLPSVITIPEVPTVITLPPGLP